MDVSQLLQDDLIEQTFKDKTIAQWLWFCNHTLEHTQAMKKQVKSSPQLPTIWPIAKGVEPLFEELCSLRQAGFHFSSLSTPVQFKEPGNVGGGSSSGKRKRKWHHGISKDAQKILEAASVMDATFLEEITNIPTKHVVFRILTENTYEVHIKEEPCCTCLDFQRRQSTEKAFIACKHMYFVYVHILGLQPREHMVIHQPILTTIDLAFLLAQSRKVCPTMA